MAFYWVAESDDQLVEWLANWKVAVMVAKSGEL